MTDKEAYIILNSISGIGPVRVKKLLDLYGKPSAILKEKASTLLKVDGLGEKCTDAISHWQKHIDIHQELALSQRAGVSILTLDDARYPELLKAIYDPPLCLYCRGTVHLIDEMMRQTLAIVGSRRSTHYGIRATERITFAAVNAGWTIVSGLAIGIDTTAHRSAIQSGGYAIAVLAGGLGNIYPQENLSLARSICDQGLLMSEHPMMMRPDRRSFPMRNRIISGLSKGTLIVEAGVRSGALITARQALDQDRQVFSVPGRIDSPQSQGCNKLIKEGAKLTEGLEDIMEEFSFLNPVAFPFKKEAINAVEPISDPSIIYSKLSILEQKIVALLEKEGEQSIDELLNAVELPSHKILSVLLEMEMKYIVKQLPGKRIVLCAPDRNMEV